MLEYSLIKQHRPRFNVRLRDDKSYPFLAVTLDDEWPRADGDARAQAQGRPLLRPVRPRLRHPRDARPAAAHVPDPHLLATTSSTSTSASAGRACSSTSRSARARASARSTRSAYDRAGRGAARLPRRRHRRRSSSGSTAEMREAAGRARVRAGGPAARPARPACSKAIEKQQMVADRNEDLDVIGIADDELEAAVQVFYVRRGRVVGRKGFIVDKVEDLDARRARRPHPRGPLRRRAAARACPSRCSCPVEPDEPDLYEEWLTELRGLAGRRPGAAAGRQARAARDGHPQRQGGVHPPPPAARRRPQQPGPGAQRAAGPPRPARGAAAHRVLRHEPHPGHRLRRARWW